MHFTSCLRRCVRYVCTRVLSPTSFWMGRPSTYFGYLARSSNQVGDSAWSRRPASAADVAAVYNTDLGW